MFRRGREAEARDEFVSEYSVPRIITHQLIQADFIGQSDCATGEDQSGTKS